MANKKERPVVENPLANMGLDEIVREITTTEDDIKNGKDGAAKTRRSKAGTRKIFDSNLEKYIGISEQGAAIWLPKEVKKNLELLRANADRNIPLRSLAAAIIMSYISENEHLMKTL